MFDNPTFKKSNVAKIHKYARSSILMSQILMDIEWDKD